MLKGNISGSSCCFFRLLVFQKGFHTNLRQYSVLDYYNKMNPLVFADNPSLLEQTIDQMLEITRVRILIPFVRNEKKKKTVCSQFLHNQVAGHAVQACE